MMLSGQNAAAFGVPPSPETIFVGRRREMRDLVSGLDHALRGQGRIFALSGEPGIGKTRLAREFASLARERGARVISASTPGRLVSAAPPYWLWIQVVRECLSALDGKEPASEAGAQASPDAPPQFARSEEFGGLELVRDGRPWLAEESCAARFRLFDATSRLLATVARSAPLILLLDDMHGADRLSFMAFEMVARELWWMPILIVATYREAEVRRHEAFDEFARGSAWAASRQLMLDGLTPKEVCELAQARTGSKPDDGTVDSIVRMTRGNPRLIEMALLHPDLLSPGGYHSKRPARIRRALCAAVEHYLGPLSQPARRLLVIAAAIGMEFELATLRAVAQCAPEQVLNGVREAEQAGLLEADAVLVTRYRFFHPIVREALYDDLAGAARARLHYRIGEALEAGFRQDDLRLEEIAHHFLEGALMGGARKALGYCERAAERALTLSQFDEASRFYAMALAAVSFGIDVDDTKRCSLMLARADAQRKAAALVGACESGKHAAYLAWAAGKEERSSGRDHQPATAQEKLLDHGGDAQLRTEPPSDGNRILRREGDYWTVVFDRKVIRLKHCKGLVCIAHLLRHPGQESYAADLCAIAEGAAAAGASPTAQACDREASPRRSANGDLGPMLDATAKAAYKRRLAELRLQADEAHALDNHERAADIEQEMSFIARELAHAVGLGGRDRRPGSEAERARVSVTNAIRATLKRIGAEHPSLARYLAGTIKTGCFCRFAPDPRFPGEWCD
jgi:AAA ATPase domain